MFSISAAGNDVRRNTKPKQISTWLHDWYHRQNFEFFDFDGSDLMTDKVHLSQRDKGLLCRSYQGSWKEL